METNIQKKLVKQTFFKFLWPTLASSLTLYILSMSDLIIAGQLIGENGLAAISLSMPIIIMVNLVKVLLSIGGAIVFSASLGRGDFKDCSKVYTLAIVGAVSIGALLGALGLIFLNPLINLLGASGGLVTYAHDYIGALLWGMPFMILAPVLVTFLRNDSMQNYSMFCVVSGAILNIVLSVLACLVFDLGMLGIGAATGISQLITCLLAGFMLFRKRRAYGLTKHFMSKELILKVLKPGSTVAFICVFQIILTIVINNMLSSDSGVAVYAVVKNLINFMFLALFDGVTSSMQPMLGIYYGEQENDNIRYTARYGFKTLMVMALIVCLFLTTCGFVVCNVFGVNEPEVRSLTIKALRLVGFYSFSAAIVSFLQAFYRSIGKEKTSFALVVIDNVLMHSIGFILFVGILKMGNLGVFYGITLSAMGTLILYTLIYHPFKKEQYANGEMTLVSNLYKSLESNLENDSKSFVKLVPASTKVINEMKEDIKAYYLKEKIDPKKQYYIDLCIEELIVNVTNLIDENKKSKKKYYIDIKIVPNDEGLIKLRIRDNLTEWTPKPLDFTSKEALLKMQETNSGVNEVGFGIIKKISKDYSYKRTIGFNNFSVTL